MNKKSQRLSNGCLSFISFCVIIIAWCIVTYGGFVDKIFMPSPTDVWNSLVSMAKDGSLAEHCFLSTKRVMELKQSSPLGYAILVNKIFKILNV